MAGFAVEVFLRVVDSLSPLKLVDLGGCELTGACELGNARAAWTYWQHSAQWHIARTPTRVLLIEGQPDRLPHAQEPLENWLAGRSGSFRGFEITCDSPAHPATVRIFTDPLGTRPIYYLVSEANISIADKLSTVLLNTDKPLEADWGGLLEAAILGSLYSYKTTVKDAVWLAPGECLEFRGGEITRRWKNDLPQDSLLSASEVERHPAQTLRLALQRAVAETWNDPETRLLLSGGLDSRILLALACGKRKTFTVDLYAEETKIAKQVAAAAGSEIHVVPPPDYEYPMRWGYLVTGAMHAPQFATHLGQVKAWRESGIPGVTHGYFHNTLYRGWTAARYEPHPFPTSVLFELMGRNAYYFEKYGCRQAPFQRDLYSLLSDDGKNVLRGQLRELADSLEPVVVDGYDLTFERRLMEFVPRQIYFACLLAWYEALDVASPIFHPAPWTWYALSRPRDRDRDWAIREVYLALDHPVAKLPDANTGRPIAHLEGSWRDQVRHQFWYAPLRMLYLKMFWKPGPYQHGGMDWGNRFRAGHTLAALEEGVSALEGNALFNQEKMRAAMDAYRRGENIDVVDSICALAQMGQWQRLVNRPELQHQLVHAVQSEAFALSPQRLQRMAAQGN